MILSPTAEKEKPRKRNSGAFYLAMLLYLRAAFFSGGCSAQTWSSNSLSAQLMSRPFMGADHEHAVQPTRFSPFKFMKNVSCRGDDTAAFIVSIVPLWYLEGISTPASGTVPSTLPLLRTLQSAAYAKNTVSAPEQRLVCGIAVLTDRPASPAVNHPVLPYLGYSLWGSRQTSQANRRKLSRLSCIVQTKVIR